MGRALQLHLMYFHAHCKTHCCLIFAAPHHATVCRNALEHDAGENAKMQKCKNAKMQKCKKCKNAKMTNVSLSVITSLPTAVLQAQGA